MPICRRRASRTPHKFSAIPRAHAALSIEVKYMLCVKCQKRPAVVFVQRLENGKAIQEGYCLTCARAMHI